MWVTTGTIEKRSATLSVKPSTTSSYMPTAPASNFSLYHKTMWMKMLWLRLRFVSNKGSRCNTSRTPQISLRVWPSTPHKHSVWSLFSKVRLMQNRLHFWIRRKATQLGSPLTVRLQLTNRPLFWQDRQLVTHWWTTYTIRIFWWAKILQSLWV